MKQRKQRNQLFAVWGSPGAGKTVTGSQAGLAVRSMGKGRCPCVL